MVLLLLLLLLLLLVVLSQEQKGVTSSTLQFRLTVCMRIFKDSRLSGSKEQRGTSQIFMSENL